MLVLGSNLSLPLTAQTETFAILAQRGAGKSNTAAVMAEEMFAHGLQFVVIDPVGAWYGLRSSADGKAPGLAIPIFGGKHGDIPLTRTSGEQVAELVVTKRLTAVIDLSTFESEAAKKQFLLAFAQKLYRQNEAPLHLFLEEADDYIPQRPMRDEAHLLRAFENLVRRGRSRGIGLTLITQRSASLNKSVLTQVGTLFAMRTTGPHDRAAVEEWVKYHLNSRDFLKSLPELKTGEAWVWSPSFLSLTERVQIRRRRTFDSGATPGRVAAKASTLADIDVAAVREQLAEVIAEAEENDPETLRKENTKLRADIAQLHQQLLHADSVDWDDIYRRTEGSLEQLRHEVSESITAAILQVHTAITKARSMPALPPTIGVPTGRMQTARPNVAAAPSKEPSAKPRTNGQVLPQMERAMLTALAQHGPLTKGQILLHTGYASSGPVSKAFARLNAAGWVKPAEGGKLSISANGVDALGHYEKLPTGSKLRDYLLTGNKLSTMEKALLSAVFEVFPAAIAKGRILERTGYASSGPVSKAFARLVRYGYAEKRGAGALRAAEEFFT